MHMFSLHALDIHQTQVILSTSLLLLLEGHTVRFCPCTSDLSFLSLFDDILVDTNPDVSISTFSTIPAVVVYLPKSKTDKRKSLLGNSEDSKKGEVVSQVSSWLFVFCKVTLRWFFHCRVLSKRDISYCYLICMNMITVLAIIPAESSEKTNPVLDLGGTVVFCSHFNPEWCSEFLYLSIQKLAFSHCLPSFFVTLCLIAQYSPAFTVLIQIYVNCFRW